MKLHKPSQKRFEGNFTYFVTFKTMNNYPYFTDDCLCDLFIEELKLCKLIKKFNLYAFCLLYDHVHLLFKPNYDISNLSDTIHFLKRHTSRNINILLNEDEVGQPHPQTQDLF